MVNAPPSHAGRGRGRLEWSGRICRWSAPLISGFVALFGVAACSIHPIPDDVSPIPTENIVASARCEVRLGLAEAVRSWFKDQNISTAEFNPNFLTEEIPRMKQLYGRDKVWARRVKEYEDYLGIGAAYDWSFDITEKDNAEGSFGFKLPFLHPGSFDLAGSAYAKKTRQGKRTFKTGDTFSVLLKRDYYDFCRGDPSHVASNSVPVGPIPRDKNILYPITGSIGLRKVVDTFLAIASQEGASASDHFVDELTFTTELNGSVNPSITLSPMTHAFRLVNASATLTANRLDMHKVSISLVFPNSSSAAAAETSDAGKGTKAKVAKKTPGAKDTASDAKDDDADGDKKVQVINVISARDAADIERRVLREGYRLSTLWRARYNLCVQEGKAREDDLKALRFTAPEVYCIESTDIFVPRDGRRKFYGNLPGRRFL